jgi:iron complex transport system ATP-binding protein
MTNMPPLLETRALSAGYRVKGRTKVVCGPLDLRLWPGKLVCLLGSNGSGKSTLMRTLAGLQSSLGGTITIANESLADLSPENLARKLSLVLTDRVDVSNLTAREVVALGRIPHTNWLGRFGPADQQKIEDATQSTGISSLLDKRLYQLSDGEKQKVMLARALTQDTDLILLDEPTAHLDLPSRIEMMRLLLHLARTMQKAILVSTHELDLALQTADLLWLLDHDGQVATGAPEDLVLNGAFESTFIKHGFSFDPISGTFNLHRGSGTVRIAVSGEEKAVLWTQKALRRAGWGIADGGTVENHIEVSEKSGAMNWALQSGGNYYEFGSIAALLAALDNTISKSKVTNR